MLADRAPGDQEDEDRAPMVAPTERGGAAEDGAEQDAADREEHGARDRERDHRDVDRDIGRDRLRSCGR